MLLHTLTMLLFLLPLGVPHGVLTYSASLEREEEMALLPLPPPSPPPPVTTTTLSDPRCSTHAGEGTDAWSTLWRQLWDESRQMLETSKDEL